PLSTADARALKRTPGSPSKSSSLMIVLLSSSQSSSRSEILRCVSRSPLSLPTFAPSRPSLPASRRVHPRARASARRGFEGGVDAERQTGRVRVVAESYLGHDGDARLAEEVHEERL